MSTLVLSDVEGDEGFIDASVLVDGQAPVVLGEEFRIAMKGEMDAQSIESTLETLEKGLGLPVTTVDVTISHGKLIAKTHGRKTFTGDNCKHNGKGTGLLYKYSGRLYSDTASYVLLRKGKTANINFFDGNWKPLGFYAGTITPAATSTCKETGPGKWSC